MALTQMEREAIAEARAVRGETRRPTVAALEDILHEAIPVLDHGLVRVVDYMGDDGAIVQAARVSYGRGTTRWRDDRSLIRYLMRHRHTTPFEMCEIKFHIKLPIFVARQWIRHRMASVNEQSARYSIVDREFYLPQPEDLGVQSRSNRQGRGDPLPPARAAEVLRLLREDAERCYVHYLDLLNEDEQGRARHPDEQGLARELSRMNLTLNYYTQWYWKIDLHNLLHFLRLRMDAHAQKEIRLYAEVIGDIVARWVPHAWEAFCDYRLKGAELSRQELEAVRCLARGEQPDLTALGLSAREQAEFRQKLGLDGGS
ncbi:MAG: FAD-dependent thymidylate synthase [Myxococcales bacterium]|nr:FAD-dependent thymidylate synthase [Myxococcota bacterium]MDW8281121.1 FAD-dependent thymidylate synthase [Myxococcales bacterium]